MTETYHLVCLLCGLVSILKLKAIFKRFMRIYFEELPNRQLLNPFSADAVSRLTMNGEGLRKEKNETSYYAHCPCTLQIYLLMLVVCLQ